MKFVFRISFIVACITFLHAELVAQGQAIISGQDSTRRVITTAVPFLTIAPDARSGAMGDVGAAISPDANASYWNASKLALIDKKFGFSLAYTPWLGKIINDMSISYLSGYYKISREQAVAMSLRYFDLGDIFLQTNLALTTGNSAPEKLPLTLPMPGF